jgi:hypothetical protein
MLSKSTDDYGLTLTDPSILRVANTPNTQFLQQPELRAIQQGLQYREIQINEELTYKGYVNKGGDWEGVGIRIRTDGYKDYGEWHLNKHNGCGKAEGASDNSWWGELKDGKREGYGTWDGATGDRYIG